MHWTDGPLLFLDVDGVLNSHAYVKRGGSLNCRTGGIDPEAVKHLQRIVDETGCAIVLSSTWRLLNTLAWMRGRLIDGGMRSPVPLRDKTPDLACRLAGSHLCEPARRGEEVKLWRETAGATGRYVCIDDDADFLPDQPLLQTTFQDGMTAAHADRCIELLRTPGWYDNESDPNQIVQALVWVSESADADGNIITREAALKLVDNVRYFRDASRDALVWRGPASELKRVDTGDQVN